jgi:hypothetical protein
MKSVRTITLLCFLAFLGISQSAIAQTGRQTRLEKRDKVNQKRQDKVDKRNPSGIGRHDNRLDRRDSRIDRKQKRTDRRVNRRKGN